MLYKRIVQAAGPKKHGDLQRDAGLSGSRDFQSATYVFLVIKKAAILREIASGMLASLGCDPNSAKRNFPVSGCFSAGPRIQIKFFALADLCRGRATYIF
jgi:hypothetical protein